MTEPIRPDGADPARPMTSLFSAVRRGWWLIAALGGMGMALGLLVSGLQTTTYAATARLLLDEQVQSSDIGPQEGDQRVDPERRLLNEVQRMGSPDVLQRASALASHVEGVGSLRSNLDVGSSPSHDLIRVTVTSSSASAAAELANAVVAAYQEVVLEQRTAELTNGITQLTARRDRLVAQVNERSEQLQALLAETQAQVRRVLSLPSEQAAEVNRRLSADPEYQRLVEQQSADQLSLTTATQQLDDANLSLSLLGTDVSIAEEARAPSSPTQPRPKRNAALGLAVGVLAGSGIAWWAADRIRTIGVGAIQSLLGAPQFASLRAGAAAADGRIDLSPFSEVGNYGRMISAALVHRLTGPRGAVVLISGIRPGSGSTTTALALGAALSRAGKTTALVDACGPGGGLTRACQAEDALGLSELLDQTVDLGEVLHRFPMQDLTSLLLIPVGANLPDPNRITDGRPGGMLELLRDNLDVVVIDGPSVLSSTGAVELAGSADLVLLVVTGDTLADELEDARQRLDLLDANIIGFVLNEHPSGSEGPPQVKGMLRLGDVPVAALSSGTRTEGSSAAPPSEPAPPPTPPSTPPTPPPPAATPAEHREPVPADERIPAFEWQPAQAEQPRSRVPATPLGFKLPARRPTPSDDDRT